MRVCFITNLYQSYARGGAERVVEEEAKALRARGHDVCVITAEPLAEDGSVGPHLTIENGVRVYRFYPLNLFFYGEIGRHNFFSRAVFHLWDLFNRSSARVVADILRKERPEIVHTHNLKGLGFLIPAAIRKLGLRHVHTLHDVQLAVPSGLLIKGREEPPFPICCLLKVYEDVMRRMIGSPDVVVSPSKFLMKFYERRGFFPRSEKILLANPAPVTTSVNDVTRRPSDETRFLFLGQIEASKGVLLLIEAMQKLLKHRPAAARLDIVGAGSLAAEATRRAGKGVRIAFYGKKNPAKFGEMFAAADYTVLPSICYENAPTVILESFAHGVPVIVADIGGAAELVRHGNNGLIFEAGNVRSLFAAMKRACEERSSWPARSQAARRTAELLSVPHHLDRLLDVYQRRDPALAHRGPVVPIRHEQTPVKFKLQSRA